MSSGCVYTHPLCQYGTQVFQTALGNYIHIGVGSDVVCSTTIGNARASESGMDGEDSTLFCVEHRTANEHKKVRYEHIV